MISKYYNREQNKIRVAEWRAKNSLKNKEYNKKYQKNRRYIDSEFKLLSNRRNRRYQLLKGLTKTSTKENLGCTIKEWKQYLESKFDANMTWDNYGSYWHLDEVIPCTAWDLTQEIDQIACFHYLNSQPLENLQNKSKGGSNRKNYTKEKQQFLLVLRALGEI